MTFSVNVKSIKLLGVGLATVSILGGCATAKVGDADKMKSAAPATQTLAAKKEPKKKAADTMSSAAATTPPPAPSAPAVTSTEPAPAKKKAKKKKAPGILDDVYVVKEGDNLWCISKLRAVYDDAYMWPLIYKRNMDTIKDPDLIYPGQRLWIERDLSGADMDAAVKHARTRGAWSVGPLEASDRKYIGN